MREGKAIGQKDKKYKIRKKNHRVYEELMEDFRGSLRSQDRWLQRFQSEWMACDAAEIKRLVVKVKTDTKAV